MSAPFAHLAKPARLKARSAAKKPTLDARVPADTVPIDVDTRLFVWQRDRGHCRNCGSRRNLHFDHVIPRSLGGASTADNVQVLCRDCNLRKGATLVDGGSN